MATEEGLEFRILGPLEARRGGKPVELGGPKQRALLALLLLRAGEVVSTDRLIDELWGEQPPAKAAHTVQVFVSRLRKALGGEALLTRAPGYVLVGDVDVERFRRLVAQASRLQETGGTETALAPLAEALALWRGPALAEFAYEPWAARHIERLEEERLGALEERLELELQLGRHTSVVAELEELTATQPLRERLHELLMLALYRSGRQSQALEVYGRLKRRLLDELGLDPGAAIQALERRILQQDSTLAEPAKARCLPDGTVTFLFTDIEGSTQLLHELGAEAYGAALEEHRRVLREAFAAHDGVEVDTQGDALFAAFRRAQDALAAAAEALAALDNGPVQVRIGVHTGEPLRTDDGYVGMDVHRAARIMTAGHGGQVVVSETTQRLVEGIALHDLGTHRLRDMTEPQRLYQLGDGVFPPLRSLNRANLPVQPTVLLGREAELADLAVMLADDHVRLVTLTGPGGAGKTRLALQAAAEAVEQMPDGVVWVPLAGVASHELVLPALARALDVREVPGEPLELTLMNFLSTRRVLVLLDNFEHVLDARVHVAGLLAGCPHLQLLATSRTTLGLSAEHVYEVPPLERPAAVELFVERARQAGAEIEADATVTAICERLDSLPLAIELAAARTRLLEPAELLARLERRLPLLSGGAADLPARQQTLVATIAWSHDLLDDEERELFRRLSVFAGGFTPDAAEAVGEAELWALDSLLAKSLVRRWGSGRLGLLETIREFADSELAKAGEREQMRERHARHYLALAVELEPDLVMGPRRVETKARLLAEHENVEAALEFYELEGAEAELLSMATAMGGIWTSAGRGRLVERWLRRPSLEGETVPRLTRVKALQFVGFWAILHGDIAECEARSREGLRLSRELGYVRGQVDAMSNLGYAAWQSGDLETAEALLTEAIELGRRADDPTVIPSIGPNLAELALARGDVERALELLEEAARICEQIGDLGELATNAALLGRIQLVEGQRAQAAQTLKIALENASDIAQAEFSALALICVARMADEAWVGAQLVGAADSRLEAGIESSSFSEADLALREQALAEAKRHLTHSEFKAAYGAGRELTLEQAVDVALAVVGGYAHPARQVTRPAASPS